MAFDPLALGVEFDLHAFLDLVGKEIDEPIRLDASRAANDGLAASGAGFMLLQRESECPASRAERARLGERCGLSADYDQATAFPDLAANPGDAIGVSD